MVYAACELLDFLLLILVFFCLVGQLFIEAFYKQRIAALFGQSERFLGLFDGALVLEKVVLCSLVLGAESLVFGVLILLPLVVGISYEFNRYAGRSESLLSRALRWPGLMVQHLTVFEPDDSMIEVAITAMRAVIPDDGSDEW